MKNNGKINNLAEAIQAGVIKAEESRPKTSGYKVDKNVVVGMYVLGHSKMDIARAVGIHRNSVDSILKRVLKQTEKAARIKKLRGIEATINHDKIIKILTDDKVLKAKNKNPENLLKLAKHCYEVSRLEDNEATAIVKNEFTEVINPLKEARIVDIEAEEDNR